MLIYRTIRLGGNGVPLWYPTKKTQTKKSGFFLFCCGGRTRTCDLWVMSPTSYRCSTPRCEGAKVRLNFYNANILGKKEAVVTSAKYLPRNDHLLHFACSFPDRAKLRITVIFFYREILCITITTEYLHRIIGNFYCDL
jgi:hypothetical protein